MDILEIIKKKKGKGEKKEKEKEEKKIEKEKKKEKKEERREEKKEKKKEEKRDEEEGERIKKEMKEALVSYIIGPEIKKERIEVKEIPRVPSGIPGFDEMIENGLEENSIVLLNGDPGSGKTIFSLQFLYEGLKRDEAGLYISFGEPRRVIYPRMLRFGMDFQKYEDKNLFFVIEYQPHEIAKLMQEEGGTIYDIVNTYKIKRVVIDPITPYLSQFTNLYDARLALTKLFDTIRKWGATAILVNEKVGEGDRISQLAEFLADGVINLIHFRNEDGIQIRGVEVWKLCGIDHTEIARPFVFSKNGIVVYPNERLFVRFKEKI